MLQKKYQVRASPANYNNEIGLPLTIIGASGGGRNPVRWLMVVLRAVATGLWPGWPLSYPAMLVLEMAADKPGDLRYLLRLAPPDVGLVTAITAQPTHLQNFKTVDAVVKEKLTMYKNLPKLARGIVNMDEPELQTVPEQAKFQAFTVGIEHPAELMAAEINCVFGDDLPVDKIGMRFKFHYQGNVVPCFIPGVIGRPIIYSALFAAAVGILYDINLIDITTALRSYQAPAGRMKVLAGKNQSVIIDDTYNAAPAAVQAALQTIKELPTTGRKIVCLGEMAELGEQASAAHRMIGEQVAKTEIDRLVVVGAAGKLIAAAAIKHGLPEEAVQQFTDVAAAGQALVQQLQPHDLLLVKGSQVARLEKVVAATLAQPELAEKLLVRQYGNWRKS